MGSGDRRCGRFTRVEPPGDPPTACPPPIDRGTSPPAHQIFRPHTPTRRGGPAPPPPPPPPRRLHMQRAPPLPRPARARALLASSPRPAPPLFSIAQPRHSCSTRRTAAHAAVRRGSHWDPQATLATWGSVMRSQDVRTLTRARWPIRDKGGRTATFLSPLPTATGPTRVDVHVQHASWRWRSPTWPTTSPSSSACGLDSTLSLPADNCGQPAGSLPTTTRPSHRAPKPTARPDLPPGL